jgi:hypothetical protein
MRCRLWFLSKSTSISLHVYVTLAPLFLIAFNSQKELSLARTEAARNTQSAVSLEAKGSSLQVILNSLVARKRVRSVQRPFFAQQKQNMTTRAALGTAEAKYRGAVDLASSVAHECSAFIAHFHAASRVGAAA